jgi:hypothetical protein
MLGDEAQRLTLTNSLGRSGEKVGWFVCCGGSNAKRIHREGLVAKTIHCEVNNEHFLTMAATATTPRVTRKPPLLLR